MTGASNASAWRGSVLPVFSAEPACRGKDPELFFCETDGGGVDAVRLAAARALCASCPVLEACRDFAIANDTWGVWGGLLRAERNKLRPRQGSTCLECGAAFEQPAGRQRRRYCSESCRSVVVRRQQQRSYRHRVVSA